MHTDVAKLIVAYRNFANAPKIYKTTYSKQCFRSYGKEAKYDIFRQEMNLPCFKETFNYYQALMWNVNGSDMRTAPFVVIMQLNNQEEHSSQLRCGGSLKSGRVVI